MEDPVSNIATSIRDELGSLPVISPLRCIYKVPHHIRKVNEESYRPLVISIGPIYHHHPSVQAMEKQKLRHLGRFLTQGNQDNGLESYIGVIRGWEQEIRRCYEEEVSLSSHDFIKMVLVDATFIIDLFMWASSLFSLENHPIEGILEVLDIFERHLYLEENQLPFFVLKGLYDIAIGTDYPHISFVDLTWSYMSCNFSGRNEVESAISEKIRQKGPNVRHFVDFLRLCCLPSTIRPNPSSVGNRYPLLRSSATELNAVGVKFIASISSSLLDIRFSQGVLQIPKFTVQDTTESMYPSILIFEHSHYLLDSYFLDYIFFLYGLIKTPEDVELLVRKGIIENWVGSNDAVANLFNVISKHISLFSSNFYYYEVCRDLNTYANTSWHRWKAVLSKDYFNHPWAIISVIYAIILLILTLLQTISGFTSK